jgi:hypothetical protein
MHHSRLAGFIIDCRTDDLQGAADFWSKALGMPPKAQQDPTQPIYVNLESDARDLHIEVQQVEHEAGSTSTSNPTTSKRRSPGWRSSALAGSPK